MWVRLGLTGSHMRAREQVSSKVSGASELSSGQGFGQRGKYRGYRAPPPSSRKDQLGRIPAEIDGLSESESSPISSGDALPTSPRLIEFVGLLGPGKSAIARRVAERWRAVRPSVDSTDAPLLKTGFPPSIDTGLADYSAAQAIGRDQLRSARDVVVDAVSGVDEGRQLWRDPARGAGATLQVVVVVYSDRAEHRCRVESRDPGTPSLAMRSWGESRRESISPGTSPGSS